jgi:hypothetical protein
MEPDQDVWPPPLSEQQTMTGDSGGPRPIPAQPTGWWDQVAEQRLNFVVQRVGEVTTSLSEVAKELRAQTRISDKQDNDIRRLEERIRDAQASLEEVRKGHDKLASSEWLLRLEKRIEMVEDEQKSPFVRKSEFDPVKKVVFGLISTLCLFVLGAVAKLIIK